MEERGIEYWGYSLIKAVRPGDTIYHYHKPGSAIAARSRAVGEVWEDMIVWPAHGTSARDSGTLPRPRPGWYLGLEDFEPLPNPVSLDSLREIEPSIAAVFKDLGRQHPAQSLYSPFALSSKRPIRPSQAYLTKLPTEVVLLIEELLPSPRVYEGSGMESMPAASVTLGSEYREADEHITTSHRDPFAVDPSIVDRGTRGHARTQNRLAEYLRGLGVEPRSPNRGEPCFDIAWLNGEELFVAEVKSLTEVNEEKQLRLGLGQVLRYRQLLSNRATIVRCVLAVEKEPSDDTWQSLCRQLQVDLVWPAAFNRIAETMLERKDRAPDT